MMKKNNLFKIIFALLGTSVVLWQLLASGYVLTLDMVFGSHIDLATSAGDLLNTHPVWWLLSILTTIFSGWFAQKILLITIFFLLFYFPLYYFSKIFKFEKTYGAEYIVSVFFVISPFIYERFLAGQWLVIFGTAMLFPITAYVIEFSLNLNLKSTLKLLVSILFLGMISIHILIMVLILMIITFLVVAIYQKFSFKFIKQIVILTLSFLVFSSYWLVPALINKNGTPLSNFNSEHWEAFRTAENDKFGGVIGNVLSLHGFWGESEPWIENFVLPKDNHTVFVVMFSLLFLLILYGILKSLKDDSHRKTSILLVSFVLISIIFSSGVGDSVFKNLNLWLFENVYFWTGFRDSQKWSAIILLGYSLFLGIGSNYILKSWKYKKTFFIILFMIPVLYTPMMLLGFFGQLKTSQYPESWSEINNVLKQDENCKALFLPWHQYYSLKFNHEILTANPSNKYFDCEIWHSLNMGIGDIKTPEGHSEDYYVIEKAITSNELESREKTINLLKEYNFKYIIFTDDVIDEDDFTYPFLQSMSLEKVINIDGANLYKILYNKVN
jgi:hypothetical protein